MPELPEVETIVRQLDHRLTGLVFGQTEISYPKIISPLSPTGFAKKLVGQEVLRVYRRAKIIIIELSGDQSILIHLKMTGQLIFQPAKTSPVNLIVGGHPQTDPSKHTRAILSFRDGSSLRFNDLRKFGWLKLVNQETREKILAPHGVEPLTKNFTTKLFAELVARYLKRKIKQLLLDQTLVAGLGNIYVDEACFRAKILPTRTAQTLTHSETTALHREIIAVLKHSIKKKGTSARNYVISDGTKGGFVPYLNVYGRGGLPCKTCGTPINKIKLNGRGTHFCPKCQK